MDIFASTSSLNRIHQKDGPTGIRFPSSPSTRKPFGEITNTSSKTPIKSGMESPHGNHATNGEILTPTANLKMLIRVAESSGEMGGNSHRRRALFASPKDSSNQLIIHSNDNEENKLVIDHDYQRGGRSSAIIHPSPLHGSINGSINGPINHINPLISSAPVISGQKYTRKDKSLGLLCERFIAHFPEGVQDGECPEIQLDDLAKQMNTERRRIYDIVNVLEAIQMMTKIGKNLYKWHGKTHEKLTLAWLKQLGQKLKLDERYHEVISEECEDTILNIISPMRRPMASKENTSCNSNIQTPSSSTNSPFSPYTPSPLERKTSLGVACQKFLMLFLVAPEPKAMNLELAAKVIHAGSGNPGPIPDSMMKTRIRRLYDIANILQSLKLIKKIHLTENSRGGKRPAFQYIGPNIDGVDVTKDMLQELPATRQRHSLLSFGKNLMDIPDEDPKLAVKKRTTPDTGFQQSNGVLNHNKMARTKTLSLNSAANKLTLMPAPSIPTESLMNKIELPHQLQKANSTPSLMDLSTVCELERQRLKIRSPQCSTSRFIPATPPTGQMQHQQHYQRNKSSPLNLSSKPTTPKRRTNNLHMIPIIHRDSGIGPQFQQPGNRVIKLLNLPSTANQGATTTAPIVNNSGNGVRIMLNNASVRNSLLKSSPINDNNIVTSATVATTNGAGNYSGIKIIRSQTM